VEKMKQTKVTKKQNQNNKAIKNLKNDYHMKDIKRDILKKIKKRKPIWLYGFHTVQAALENPHRNIKRIIATKEAIVKLNKKNIHLDRINQVELTDKKTIEILTRSEGMHQGIAIQTTFISEKKLEEVIPRNNKQKAILIVLDNITDSHNVGAILRSADAFGATALVLSKHGSPIENGTLAKAASGALERIPIIRVSNLARSIKKLQNHNFWSIGLDENGAEVVKKKIFPERCILVLGSEGKGMRPNVKKACDIIARLPTNSPMASINVSNASAIALYEWNKKIK